MALRSFRDDFVALIGIQAVNLLFPIVITSLAARALGAAGIGACGFLVATAAFFQTTISFGWSSFGVVETSKQNAVKNVIVSVGLLIQIIAFCVITPLYFVLLSGLTAIPQKHTIVLYLALMASSIDLTWLLLGSREYRRLLIRNLFAKVVSFVIVLSMVRASEDVVWYLVAMYLPTLIVNVWMVFEYRGYVTFGAIKMAAIKPLFVQSGSVFCSLFLMTSYSIIDKILIGKIVGLSSLGTYDQAMRLIAAAATVAVSMRPFFASSVAENMKCSDKAILAGHLRRGVETTAFMSFAICTALFVFSDWIVFILLGAKFGESAHIIRLMAVSIVLMAYGDLCVNQILLPLGRQKQFFSAIFIITFLMCVLNLILIPRFHAEGAVAAFLISHFLVLVYEIVLVRDVLPLSKILKPSLPYVFATLISLSLMHAIHFIQNQTYVTLLNLLQVTLVFSTVLFFTKNELIRRMR